MTKRTLDEIITELDDVRAQCLAHARAESDIRAARDWNDLALQTTIAREIAVNGICPALSLSHIHAAFRSMELEALHSDIRRALNGGGS